MANQKKPADLISRVARDIIANEQNLLPDLSSVVIILPNQYASKELTREILKTGKRPLILPKITTLKSWAEQTESEFFEHEDVHFISEIYVILRDNRLSANQKLWGLASEIFLLFKEITLNSTSIPENEDDFLTCFSNAFAKFNLQPIEYEAQLISSLWQAFWTVNMNSREKIFDSSGSYMLRLRSLLNNYSNPLYVIGTTWQNKVEKEFLELYVKKTALNIYELNDPRGQDQILLRHIFIDCFNKSTTEINKNKNIISHSSFMKNSDITIFNAKNVEEEASHVANQVVQWVDRGLHEIAVVGLDKVTARRIRALLARNKIFMRDELGWLMSTTSACTVVMRWLDICAGNFKKNTLRDLVFSPFLAVGDHDMDKLSSDWNKITREVKEYAQLDEYKQVGDKLLKKSEFCHFLDRLLSIIPESREEKNKSLSQWIAWLGDSLSELGITKRLSTDIAGYQILNLLEKRRLALIAQQDFFDLREFIQWARQEFETNNFFDESVVSPIVLTGLANVMLRNFDAVVLVGCDVTKLPGSFDRSIFGNSVKRELKLPGDESMVHAVGEDLIWLINQHVPMLFTWQSQGEGYSSGLSPMLDILNTYKIISDGKGYIVTSESIPKIKIQGTGLIGSRDMKYLQNNRLALAAHDIPKSISTSGYTSILRCPYQYFVRHILNIRQWPEEDGDLTKAQSGEAVHTALFRFHQLKPNLRNMKRDQAISMLVEILGDCLKGIGSELQRDSWLLEYELALGKYIDWQMLSEHEGWGYVEGEIDLNVDIQIDQYHDLTLKGRVDRLDKHKNGGLRVIDYKTSQIKSLKDAVLRPDENIQLLFYIYLLNVRVDSSGYLGINKDSVKFIDLEDRFFEFSKKNISRLRSIFLALYHGAPLPANGNKEACVHCEVRGICRRSYTEQDGIS